MNVTATGKAIVCFEWTSLNKTFLATWLEILA